jgi:AGZA family xanthine/uracil permease-like MFS transporter
MSHSTELEPTPPKASDSGAIARFFKFAELKTNLRTEIIAGITTFVTMAYILVVNPAILSNAIFLQESGDLFGELVIATAISSAIATLCMGFLSNYPFALAPGMGLNAFFAFSVVLGMGISWQVALAAVLIEGIIFIALTLSNIRSQIIRAIPESLKRATAAGIGLFIAYIALTGNPAAPPEGGYGAGLIVSSPVTTTTLGNFAQPPTLMAIIGLFLTAAFLTRNVKGALLWGIVGTALLGWVFQVVPPPQGIIALPQFPSDLIGQALVGLGQLNSTNISNLIAATFVFLFVDLFDTVGTLSGVGMQAGMINEQGELPRAKEALLADAIGTTVGALLGTSTVTTYIESASGVSEGGRSGFTAVVTALLFVVAILFIPLFAAIPAFATAPALIIVGVLMMSNVASIRWSDPAEAIASFLTIFMMPLTFSIAEGLAIGFITYPLLKTFQGKAQEIGVAVWVLAAVFVLRFVLMALEIV